MLIRSLTPISIRKLCLLTFFRFYSTNDPEKLTSLDEYISRMKQD